MRSYSEAVKATGGEANEPTSPAERDPDFVRAGHACGHPLQLMEELAVQGRCGAGIAEGS